MNNETKTMMTKKEADAFLKRNGNRLVDDTLTSFVSLQKVNKVYPNGVHAVYDFDLEIDKHEFVALVGPSGCGKSTTLRMIAGLEDISSGRLYIDKAFSNYLQSKDRDIAMVFQSYALYPQMSVFDNIAFGLKIRKLPKDEIEHRVFKAADILDLGDYLDRKPKELSGGQMQRVALGRAIVRQANLFLMDEPLSNLDAKLRVQMRSEIMRIHKEVGATTIYVTHDQTEAMTMADVIVVMNKGFIQQAGRAIDVYDHPDNLFVATFIGSPPMNIVDANYKDNKLTFADGSVVALDDGFDEVYRAFIAERIAELDAQMANFDELTDEAVAKMRAAQVFRKEEKKPVEMKKKENFFKKLFGKFTKKRASGEKDDERVKLLEEMKRLKENYLAIALGGAVKVGVRPEHVTIGDEGEGTFNARSTLVELLGSECIVHFDLFGTDFQVKTQQNASSMADKVCSLTFEKGKIHVFDADSGLVIRR